jgi:phage-related protein
MWLRDLPADERRIIGEDLRVVQFRWPLGMPLVRKLAPGLWELRSTIPDGIARLFTIWTDRIVALHAFVKKSQKTPANELETALRRLADFKRNAP